MALWTCLFIYTCELFYTSRSCCLGWNYLSRKTPKGDWNLSRVHFHRRPKRGGVTSETGKDRWLSQERWRISVDGKVSEWNFSSGNISWPRHFVSDFTIDRYSRMNVTCRYSLSRLYIIIKCTVTDLKDKRVRYFPCELPLTSPRPGLIFDCLRSFKIWYYSVIYIFPEGWPAH